MSEKHIILYKKNDKILVYQKIFSSIEEINIHMNEFIYEWKNQKVKYILDEKCDKEYKKSHDVIKLYIGFRSLNEDLFQINYIPIVSNEWYNIPKFFDTYTIELTR